MTFTLGNNTFDKPVMLAPMSGVSDYPFRALVKGFGADLVFSEMIASRSVIQEYSANKRSNEDYTEEHPIAVQLAGCEPEIMAEAAKINADRGADIIDINFGCPVKKIVKKFAGSAIMQDEDLATRIMDAVVKAVDIPVTMKMRLGWDGENLNAPSLARKAEDVGIRMITVHGRTRDQMYNGNANWNAVAATKQAVSIPVIINGDIKTPQDAQTAMQQSGGTDGVMIGRGCCGKPWLLHQTMTYLKDGTIPPNPNNEEKLSIILKHYDAMLDYYGEFKGISHARKHLAWYCTDMSGAAELRNRINSERNPNTVKKMLTEFFL